MRLERYSIPKQITPLKRDQLVFPKENRKKKDTAGLKYIHTVRNLNFCFKIQVVENRLKVQLFEFFANMAKIAFFKQKIVRFRVKI